MDQLELDFAVAVFSDYDADGHLTIGIDAPGLDGKEGVAPCEALLPWGLLARPLDPDKDSAGVPTQGAGLLSVMHGDTRQVMPLSDPRVTSKLPKVRKGGSGLYGGSGDYYSFVLIDGVSPSNDTVTGSITVAAPYDKGGTRKSHMLMMLVREAGDEAVLMTHGEGHGLMLTQTGKRAATLKNAAGDASIGVNDVGITLNGKTKVIGPCTVGDPVAAQGVVLASFLITYLTALEVKLASSPVGALPLPIASLAAAMTTKLLKGA